MLRRVSVIVLALLLLILTAAIAGLAWAHLSLRSGASPLPDLLSLASPPPAADGPISVSYINTASQAMPRAAVLDAGTDPAPEAPYVMSHPSFVLRWADGRMLLIDAGMTADAAVEFGKPLEWLAGAQPVQPQVAVAAALGEHVDAVGGILFTHLHADHVGGLAALCERRHEPLTIFMTQAQARLSNYTTQPGRRIIENAGCARVSELPEGTLPAVPGFPGVSVFAAAGHTPGSQVVLAGINASDGPHLYVFLGDVVNNIDGVNHNLSKPFLYSLLVVPEDDTRLATLRVLLRRLRDQHGATLLPAHDQLAIEATGVPAYRP